MFAFASVAMADFAGVVYGWRWPLLVEEDLALSGGRRWGAAAAVTTTAGTFFGGIGGVGFGGRAALTLGRPEVSRLDNLVLLLVSVFGEAAADFRWLQRVVHYVSTGGGFSANQFFPDGSCFYGG